MSGSGTLPLLRQAQAGHRPERGLLQSFGGFLWWYLEFFDAQGNGLVFIWSFGLPFLPGYSRPGRLHKPARAGDRPSLNVVVYRAGQEAFYLLQEYDPKEVEWADNHWRFGETRIRVDNHDDTCDVTVDLDMRVPSMPERLRGSVSLSGRLSRNDIGEASNGSASSHAWSLVSARAHGSAKLTLGDEAFFDASGRGYHDCNSSPVPLHQLGIRHWIWGRVPFEDREWIFYLLWPSLPSAEPTLLAIEQRTDGTTRVISDLKVKRRGARLGRYGMPFWDELDIQHQGAPVLVIRMKQPLEDGPFYLRAMTTAEDARGRKSAGTMELCRPGRVDRALLRPFVRMRVDNRSQANSTWLPLFSGPRQGRIARQVSVLGTRLRGTDAQPASCRAT